VDGAAHDPTATGELTPTPRTERVDALDVLRGFALLGILLVNIELFRGPVLFDTLAGADTARSGSDRVAQFLIGWLASGKFISSFALMFGVGAAMMVRRAEAAGRRPRRLLVRRYLWLAAFGLVHMFLLFPGDILFIYGLAGLILLLFVNRSIRSLLRWAAGLLTVYLLFMVGSTVLASLAPAPQADPAVIEMQAMFTGLSERASTAYVSGDLAAIASMRAWEVLIVQGGSMFVLPSVLALFLIGLAAGKAGIVDDLAGHRALLRRASAIGLAGGLVLNVPVGVAGILGGAAMGPAEGVGPAMLLGAAIGQTIGAPLLAVGYLSTLALACLRPGVVDRLAVLRDTGRMALTGYILQSVLASTFFVWLGFYGRLTLTSSLVVVVVIWVVVLATCGVGVATPPRPRAARTGLASAHLRATRPPLHRRRLGCRYRIGRARRGDSGQDEHEDEQSHAHVGDHRGAGPCRPMAVRPVRRRR
jgi:uncharacterized protein